MNSSWPRPPTPTMGAALHPTGIAPPPHRDRTAEPWPPVCGYSLLEVPGLPGVALDEAEPAGVGGQPGVGGGRSEVELGAVAVQALAGRRHPLRIRVRREQARLLGVGAVATRHEQREAYLGA